MRSPVGCCDATAHAIVDKGRRSGSVLVRGCAATAIAVHEDMSAVWILHERRVRVRVRVRVG